MDRPALDEPFVEFHAEVQCDCGQWRHHIIVDRYNREILRSCQCGRTFTLEMRGPTACEIVFGKVS